MVSLVTQPQQIKAVIGAVVEACKSYRTTAPSLRNGRTPLVFETAVLHLLTELAVRRVKQRPRAAGHALPAMAVACCRSAPAASAALPVTARRSVSACRAAWR